MEVRSPFQQLSAPVTRLQCHPWSCFFILFLPVSLTGQRKLHFKEDFAVKQLLLGSLLNQDLGACSNHNIVGWREWGFFVQIPGECATPQPRAMLEKRGMYTNGDTHDIDHHWCCAERCSLKETWRGYDGSNPQQGMGALVMVLPGSTCAYVIK